jgi:hypothetical protein
MNTALPVLEHAARLLLGVVQHADRGHAADPGRRLVERGDGARVVHRDPAIRRSTIVPPP